MKVVIVVSPMKKPPEWGLGKEKTARRRLVIEFLSVTSARPLEFQNNQI